MEDSEIHLDISLSNTPPVFHPHLTIRLPPRLSSGEELCKTLISLHLPDEVFVDPNELSDLYAISGNPWRVIPEVIDIERPVRNSSEGMELRLGIPDDVEEVDVPLHVRYLPPESTGSREVIVLGKSVDDVRAGRSCEAHSATTLQSVRIPQITLSLPTGKPSHQIPVELTTAAIIWLGWLYLAIKIYRMVQRVKRSELPEKRKTS